MSDDDEPYPRIKDHITGMYFYIYKPEFLQVTLNLLDTVEIRCMKTNQLYRFRKGDAMMAGIKIEETETLFHYANKQDEFQHGDTGEFSIAEDTEKLT